MNYWDKTMLEALAVEIYALDEEFMVSVDDGQERTYAIGSPESLVKACQGLDDCGIDLLLQTGRRVTFYLVFGNASSRDSAPELVCDYTDCEVAVGIVERAERRLEASPNG